MEGKDLTLDLLYESSELSGKDLVDVQWTPAGDAFTYFQCSSQNDSRYVWSYDLKTRTKEVLIDSNYTPVLGIPEMEKLFALSVYLWSPTGKDILLPSDADLYLYDVASRSVRRLTYDEEIERDPQLSPDGKKIAFIKNHNIYVLDIETGNVVPLTTEGREHMFVGQFDWIYEEEFEIRTRFFWSPNSQYIAFLQLDETGVPEFSIVDFIPSENQVQTMRYPKGGENNSIVRVGVVSLDNPHVVWFDIGTEIDIYIPRIKWFPDSQSLAIYRLNRSQNRLELMVGDVVSGETWTVLVEAESKGWVDIHDDLTFLNDSEHFLWSSNRDGFRHLYLYDVHGQLIRQLTGGRWEVDTLIAVDEPNGLVYFSGSQEKVWERYLYRV